MKTFIYILLLFFAISCDNKKLSVFDSELYPVDTLGTTLQFYRNKPFTGFAKKYDYYGESDSTLMMEREYNDGLLISQKYFTYFDDLPTKPIKSKIEYDKSGAGKKIEYTVSGLEKTTVKYDTSGKIISYSCSEKPITINETYESIIGTWHQIEENRQPGTRWTFIAEGISNNTRKYTFVQYTDDGRPIATFSNAYGNYMVYEPGVVYCSSPNTGDTKAYFVDCRRIVVRGNIILEKQ